MEAGPTKSNSICSGCCVLATPIVEKLIRVAKIEHLIALADLVKVPRLDVPLLVKVPDLNCSRLLKVELGDRPDVELALQLGPALRVPIWLSQFLQKGINDGQLLTVT